MNSPLTSKSRSAFVAASLSLFVLPALALLPGCGGGAGGGYSVGTFSSAVILSSAQTAVVTLNTGGGGTNGFLNVAAPIIAADGKQTSAFSFVVPKGNYPFSGVFTPPTRFTVAGTFPGNVRFTIEGQVPANGGSGNYVITANGQTVSGTLRTGTIVATSTPSPTSTSTPAPTSTPLP